MKLLQWRVTRLASNFRAVFLIAAICLPGISHADIPTTQRASDLNDFAKFKFSIPSGWKQAPTNRDNRIQLDHRSTDDKDADAMIQITYAKPPGTAQKVAEAFAGPDGHIAEEPVMVDGVEALRVSAPAGDLSRPAVVIVAFRGDTMFLMMTAGTDPKVAVEGLVHVVNTWKWIPQKSTSQQSDNPKAK